MAKNSQIVRMLNGLSFDSGGGGVGGTTPAVDLCPPALEKEIDVVNDFVYEKASRVLRSEILYCGRKRGGYD